jgi:hypothetical protein
LGPEVEEHIATGWERLDNVQISLKGLGLRWTMDINSSNATTAKWGREDRRLGIWMLYLAITGIIILIVLGGPLSASHDLFAFRFGLYAMTAIMMFIGPVAFVYGSAELRRGRTQAVLPLDGSSDGQWAGAEIAINRILTALGLWMQEIILDDDGRMVNSLEDAIHVEFKLPEDLSITLERGRRGKEDQMTVGISGIEFDNYRKAKKLQLLIDGLPFQADRPARR